MVPDRTYRRIPDCSCRDSVAGETTVQRGKGMLSRDSVRLTVTSLAHASRF
jgi:hypothetical protein